MTGYYDEATKGPHRVFELADFELETGGTLPGGRLLYKAHGQLNAARDNAILFPHMYSGTSSSVESVIAPGRALDPARWFVICPGQLGNGFSSSPSNTEGPFPAVTIGDDVRAQHRLVAEALGVDRLALVTGFSMGAQQAYEWAVRFPSMVERLAPVAGSARTTEHCARVVALAEEALRAGGLGLQARVWASTALPPELYRAEAWRDAGFTSPDDVTQRLFVDDFAAMDAGNLLCQLRKWRLANVARFDGDDLSAALGRVTAQTTVIAFSLDPLFPVADCAAEARLIPAATLAEIESPWGHYSWEMTVEAREALDLHLGQLLGSGRAG
jgi:homoserine O-acetyltransferase/O-succinyltransferase